MNNCLDKTGGKGMVPNKPPRKVKPSSSAEMLMITGVREYLEDREDNDFEPHPTKLANRHRRARVEAALRLLDSL